MFYIQDYHGNIIHNASRVKGGHDFAFKAETSGFHTLHFDNFFGSTSKKVYLTLNIVPAVAGISLPSIFMASGLIVMVVGTFPKKGEEIPASG